MKTQVIVYDKWAGEIVEEGPEQSMIKVTDPEAPDYMLGKSLCFLPRDFKKCGPGQTREKNMPDNDFYRITCTLGWREYTERFRGVDMSRVFITTMLGKDKPKWMSSTKIAAKASNTLTIECDELEEIMESKDKAKLPDDIAEKIKRFLTGQWKNAPDAKTKESPPPSKADGKKIIDDDDAESLRDICQRNDWDESKARRILRASGAKREGRWRWTKEDAADIEKQLRAAFK